MKKAKSTPAAVVAEAPAKKETSTKILVAEFLEKNTTFQTSRQAHKAFQAAHPKTKVKQNYFYTLFKMFGTRVQKKDIALRTITSGDHKNSMQAYNAYKGAPEFTGPEAKVPVSFAYFRNLWRRHFNVPAREMKVRDKEKVKEKVKVNKKAAKASPKIIEISGMTAKEVVAKANELLKAKAKGLPTNIKNKAGIVKAATMLFTQEGYLVK